MKRLWFHKFSDKENIIIKGVQPTLLFFWMSWIFVSFTVWIFYGGAMAALLVLRYKEPKLPRPYKVMIIVTIVAVIQIDL